MVDSSGEQNDDAASASDDSSDGGPMAQMDPLDLRFSQRKMRNVFTDGNLIADSTELVRAVKLPPDEVEIYGAQWHLEAPFPPIEVMRWRCKLRDDTTGRPLVDPNTGEQIFEAEESWFTLDNRRLMCLQQAALRLVPERCTVDARIEIRKERRLREIRKFRTQDNGNSINVGSVVDGVPFVRWCWSTAKDEKNGGQTNGHNKNGKGKGGKGANAGKGRTSSYKGYKDNLWLSMGYNGYAEGGKGWHTEVDKGGGKDDSGKGSGKSGGHDGGRYDRGKNGKGGGKEGGKDSAKWAEGGKGGKNSNSHFMGSKGGKGGGRNGGRKGAVGGKNVCVETSG